MLLAGIDQYNRFISRAAPLRVAAAQLLPGQTNCDFVDDMLLLYDHKQLIETDLLKNVWYHMAAAHLAIFIGHPHPRCDGNERQKYVTDAKAQKEFATRVYGLNRTNAERMKVPSFGVFGDMAGRAAMGMFLELCEEPKRKSNLHGSCLIQWLDIVAYKY